MVLSRFVSGSGVFAEDHLCARTAASCNTSASSQTEVNVHGVREHSDLRTPRNVSNPRPTHEQIALTRLREQQAQSLLSVCLTFAAIHSPLAGLTYNIKATA